MSESQMPHEPNGNGGSSGPEFAKLRTIALIAGLIGIGVYGVLGLTLSAVSDSGGTRQFFLSWLTAWVFWLSLPVGCMALSRYHLRDGGQLGRFAVAVFRGIHSNFAPAGVTWRAAGNQSVCSRRLAVPLVEAGISSGR